VSTDKQVKYNKIERGERIIPDGAVVGEGFKGRALVVVVERSRVATSNMNIYIYTFITITTNNIHRI
jgi:hypothetical protein